MAIIVSDTNEGPVVNIAAWFGTIVMVLGVGTRIWSKYHVVKKFTIDDALIFVSMVSVLLEVDGPHCANYSDESFWALQRPLLFQWQSQMVLAKRNHL